jgi:hypothetical protein
MSEQDFNVTVDPDGVWRVECPAIPETYCRGDTRDAAVEAVHRAIRQREVEVRLREMAANGESLAAMVDFVLSAIAILLPHQEVATIPMLSCFCRAFSLPLRVVLPLREWVHDRIDNDEIRALLAQLESFRNGESTQERVSAAYARQIEGIQ